MKYTYYSSAETENSPDLDVAASAAVEMLPEEAQSLPSDDDSLEQSNMPGIEKSSKSIVFKRSLFKSRTFLLLVLNIAIWGAAALYLKNASPLYQTSWGVIVLGSEDSKADVQLPDAGRASTTSSGSRAQSFEDARADYIYIAQSAEVLRKAAERAEIDDKSFEKPEITADEDSAVISFVQTAGSPELAQRQAYALYSSLYDYIEELRKSALFQKQSQNNLLIKNTRDQVKTAQSQLAAYKKSSEFESDAQLDNLTAGIEELRRKRAEYKAQTRGLEKRVGNLTKANGDRTKTASDAYKLSGDDLFQSTLAEYGRLKAELSTLTANLKPQHPEIVQLRAELRSTESALRQRSQQLLGRSFPIRSLTQIESDISDPQVQALYGDVFSQTIEGNADKEQLQVQGFQLENEIEKMQARLDKLSQEKLVVDRLKRELQVAEAVLASKVAKLSLNEEDIYSIYPPIKLVVKPEIPNEDEPVSPSVRVILLTALAASFIATTGILLFRKNASLSEEEVFPVGSLFAEKKNSPADSLVTPE